MEVEEITFGKPWRYSKDSLGVVVPIFRKTKEKRNYVTLEEVRDNVKITDTGQINKLKGHSSVRDPVFIRSGTMFEGQGTQSRAPNVSIILFPEKETEIPVSCIHASHGISIGASFTPRTSVPTMVHNKLMCCATNRANQSNVWSTISDYSSSSGMAMSDNLARTVSEVEKFKGDINKIIENIPLLDNQIGVAVIDTRGVVGIEVFDNTKSWIAIWKDVMKKYSDTIVEKTEVRGVFKFDEKQVKPLLSEFIKSLWEGRKMETFKDGTAVTVTIDGEDIIGEYTILDMKIIHLIGLRREKERISYPGRTGTIPWNTRSRGTWTTASTPRTTVGTSYMTLSAVGSGKSTWSDIQKTTKKNPDTLNTSLKELQRTGFIDKRVSERGFNYSLTAKGKKFLLSFR